jgi:hypothetical protein
MDDSEFLGKQMSFEGARCHGRELSGATGFLTGNIFSESIE